MMRRMNRPQSAPATRPADAGEEAKVGVVGRGIDQQQTSSTKAKQRIEYRPRNRPASGKALGFGPARGLKSSSKGARLSAVAQKRHEVVNEYMLSHVDPLLQSLVTHLLATQPEDVNEASVAHLRKLRRGGSAKTEASRAQQHRKVARADRVFMVKQISPLVSELLKDILKSRPADPTDFIIAWLTAKRGVQPPPTPPNEEEEVPSSVRSKYREAVSFDQHVQRSLAKDQEEEEEGRPTSPTSVADQGTAAAAAAEEAAVVIEEKVILVLGETGSGKSTFLKALGGDPEPECRPTTGFKTHKFPHADDAGEPDGTHLVFCDLSGRAKARRTWFANFSDVHAVVFVVDCSKPLGEARAAFDTAFRPPEEDRAKDERRSMILGKPLLVVANKQDLPGAAGVEDVARELDLDALPQAAQVALCAAVGNPKLNGGAFDDRLEKALEWLGKAVDLDGATLGARVTRDLARVAELDKIAQLNKEKRVFRKTMRKAFPQDGSAPQECFDEAEGLEFFGAELGCTDLDTLAEEAKHIAQLVGYQKLALQILGNMHNPINPQKRAPADWPTILQYATDRKNEAWQPDVLRQDELDDPMNNRNR